MYHLSITFSGDPSGRSPLLSTLAMAGTNPAVLPFLYPPLPISLPLAPSSCRPGSSPSTAPVILLVHPLMEPGLA